MDNDSCPVCESDRYLNPNLKLLVSPCYHKMCENCISRIFLAGPAPCPICKTILRRSNFVSQTFEDLIVEKEIQIRKKRIEDFNMDARKYNDYLEQVENILSNLVNNVDVQETYEIIERFRQENKEIIAMNLSKQLNEDKMVTNRIHRDAAEKKLKKELLIKQANSDAHAKRVEKMAASTDKEISEILHTVNIKKEDIFEMLPVQEEISYESMDFDPFDDEYVEVVVDLQTYNDPWTLEALTNKSALAAGFLPAWTYTRAISSAYSGLFD